MTEIKDVNDLLKKRYTNDLLKKRYTSDLKEGPLIVHLRNMTNPPPIEIIDQANAIRRNYRNPTAHPEKIYDMDEVQDLLSECIAVVDRIVNCLKDRGIIL